MKSLLILLLVANIFCYSCNRGCSQNRDKYIVELIGPGIDYNKLKLIVQQNGITAPQLYQWKNHTVLYSNIKRIEELTKQLTTQFPKKEIKVYDKPFYNFLREEGCPGSQVASEWEHFLLTVNLVDDKKLQEEYIGYHKTQYDEWPEVSEGFCNAGFQQVTLYKNGRQLMLVISIPKGKSLDDLNPKTVESNPRMEKWNQIMGKYQEGLTGTEPGENWVFLNKIKIE